MGKQRRSWGWFAAIFVLCGTSRADTILLTDRPLVAPFLSQSRLVFSYVPATLAREGWAETQLRQLRTAPRAFARPQPLGFGAGDDTRDASDGGTDQIDTSLRLDVGDGNGLEADPEGAAALAAALAAWGLSAEQIDSQVPRIATTLAVYAVAVNESFYQMAMRLRLLFSLKGTVQEPTTLRTPSGKQKQERGVVQGRGGGSAAEDAAKEDAQKAKKVVRSAFKIIFGFVLGVLLWIIVSRSGA